MRRIATALLAGWMSAQVCPGTPLLKDDGYRGIWYCNEATKDEYKFKYSGGMATYPQQHVPIAIYSPQANKTFFCYGGTTARGGKGKQLTRNSARNHTYVRRPVNANPDFYALWADGNARQSSESYLYFTNQRGDHVWRLPASMTADSSAPEQAW